MEDLACLPALVAHGWADGSDEPTCVGANARAATRVDHVLLNDAARRLGAGCRVDWSLGLPTHAAHWVSLPCGEAEMVPRWIAPRPMPEPTKDGLPALLAYGAALTTEGPAWELAKSTGNPGLLWQALQDLARKYHALRAGGAGPAAQHR